MWTTRSKSTRSAPLSNRPRTAATLLQLRLMLQVIDEHTSVMGLVASNEIQFDPASITTPLTVRDPTFLSAFTLKDAPQTRRVHSVSDVSDGSPVVVTVPLQDYSEYGYRVFWGKPST